MADNEVDLWMTRYDNPMKDVVERVRRIMLHADDRVDECIKWQAPTFTYKGNIASFFPKATRHASLMFHQGALIPGTFPHLLGDGKEGRSMTFISIAEAEERRDELTAIVQAWIAMRDAA
ncbi:DUF1801 domain-containing protein [Demequina lignilytica]|uniref:DUF1801 domain-containing protein n=1 Tax=Demequina lignilytica TaxID=3051663 RepID=A0AAW7M938_9MICO|nr:MULTISPECIES: DUF1801 domain-containing protein [unclassified Demequina]MDN4478845.1 DUF1801 domain-containing protein [Demequina sp. SYSU T00039-1]MDN4484056.1 DUF1801 domain-containing protein [Demequina sp. SYSU T0a273]MDN4488943.1 DUF1801 domain-containing protein [Demequina sp. SYSU T00039]MDN4490361.1 DUF1801 domain-containing protein [Demequina sp. SYSU T00068]